MCQGVGGLCILVGVHQGNGGGSEPSEAEPASPLSPRPRLSTLLASPRLLLPLVSVTVAAVTVGWLESLLSLFLTSTFSLSLSAVGLCFLLWSVVYTAGEYFTQNG